MIEIILFIGTIWIIFACVFHGLSYEDVKRGVKFSSKKQIWIQYLGCWFWPISIIYIFLKDVLLWPLNAQIKNKND